MVQHEIVVPTTGKKHLPERPLVLIQVMDIKSSGDIASIVKCSKFRIDEMFPGMPCSPERKYDKSKTV